MCSSTDEEINHIVNECPKLPQKEHKIRYHWIVRTIHWVNCGANGIHVNLRPYEY